VVAEIQAHLNPNSGVDKSWRRNASLAWLKLSFQSPSPSESGMDPERVQSLLTYLEKYGEATTAYNDLRPFAERLGPEDRIQLVRILTGNSDFGDAEKFKDGKPRSSKALSPSSEDVRFASKCLTQMGTRY
jgi:N-terminal acetyltransferase B complex non-catalytic subunit